jgi:hypothetical protein
MKKSLFIILVSVGILITLVFFWFLQENALKKVAELEVAFEVPRVLIITTGKGGYGQLPEGALLMMENLTHQGAYVRINNRDALLNEGYLEKFHVLVLMSSIEFHDADRKYSLTFMEDVEVQIISKWVHNGGFLIAGDNIGRNLRDGTDRISMYGRLDPENWGFSECFGVLMSERNIQGFSLRGNISHQLSGEFIPEISDETWILIPDSLLNDKVRVLAYWERLNERFPAMIENHYGDGICILLPTSYLLHPSNNGGLWSPFQIRSFCQYVMGQYFRRFPHRIELHPWPSGNSCAFAVSLNSDGSLKEYEKLLIFLEDKKIQPTLFVNSLLDKEIIDFILKHKMILQSNAFSKINMRNLSLSETVFQIEMNSRFWNKKFTGFRFPFTMNNFWGMDFLDRKKYMYDSSIGINHKESFYGSIFPYHLPVYQFENYRTLQMLELGPVEKDDYFFFGTLLHDEVPDQDALFESALLFDAYLQNFFHDIVLLNNGMMIYLGHPLYTAFNDTTLMPLSNLIDTAVSKGAWMTTPDEIANRWNMLDNLRLHVKSSGKIATITVELPENMVIHDLTLKVYSKPNRIEASIGNVTITEEKNQWLIIFDATHNLKLKIWF